MQLLKNVLGLDLGSHSIKAVELRQTLRGLEVVQMRMLPRSGAEVSLPELVRGFSELHELTTAHVVAAVPSDQLATRPLDFPFRERRKLAASIPFALESSVPFELDDYLTEWGIAHQEKSHARVLASIVRRQQVAELIGQLREAGTEPRTVEAEGPSLANLGGVFELPGTRLLVDLGHRKTTFCVLCNGQAVAARAVPVAGEALTRAVAEERGISLEDAERAKCEDGVLHGDLSASGPPGRLIDRLIRETMRTLGSVESLVSREGVAPISAITLFGGGAELERLDELFEERTGLPCQRLGLPPEGAVEGLAAGGSPRLFAPAIALALRGTSRAVTRLDFRKDDLAVRIDLSGLGRELRGTAVLAGAAALLAAVSVGVGLFVESGRAVEVEDRVAKLYSEAQPGQPPQGSPVAAMREAVRLANERAEFLGVYHGNRSALDLLAEVSRRIPADLKISVEELVIDRQSVRIKCNTERFGSADRLKAQLEATEAFGSVRIGSIERDRKTGATRFNVTIGLATPERA